MMRFFFFIVLVLFLSIIISRVFDIKAGHWYMCFSLKDYVVRSIFEPNKESSGFKRSNPGTEVMEPARMRKPTVGERWKFVPEPSFEPSRDAKEGVSGNVKNEGDSRKIDDRETKLMEKKISDREKEKDLIGEIIQRAK